MANVAESSVKTIPWRNGMRVTGKYEMFPKEYGEYLMRSGKRQQNVRKRKHLAKAFS